MENQHFWIPRFRSQRKPPETLQKSLFLPSQQLTIRCEAETPYKTNGKSTILDSAFPIATETAQNLTKITVSAFTAANDSLLRPIPSARANLLRIWQVLSKLSTVPVLRKLRICQVLSYLRTCEVVGTVPVLRKLRICQVLSYLRTSHILSC